MKRRDARNSHLEQASEEKDWRKSLNSPEGQSCEWSYKFLLYCGQDEKDRRVILDSIPCVVVTSLETDAFMATVAYIDLLTVRSNLSARSRKEGTQGSVAILKEKEERPRLCVSRLGSNEFYSTERWRIGMERFGGTHQKILRMHLVQNWIRERKRQSGGIIQKGEPHGRNPCAPSSEGHPPEETSRQADCTSKVVWNLARTYASSKPKTTTFYSLVKAPETLKTLCLLWILELQCTMLSKEIWAQIQWILWEGPKPHMRLAATGSSANKRVSTSFCSWSRSVRNSANTRWNASDSIASQTLLKARIFISVENGETPQLTKHGKTITCTMDNSELLVVSRLSSHSSSRLSSTSRS